MTTQNIKNLFFDPKMHISLTWAMLAGMLGGIWYRSAMFTNLARDVKSNTEAIGRNSTAIVQLQTDGRQGTTVSYDVKERMARMEAKQDSMQDSLNQVILDIRSLAQEVKKK